MKVLGHIFEKTYEDELNAAQRKLSKVIVLQVWKTLNPITYEDSDIKAIIDAFIKETKPTRVKSISIEPAVYRGNSIDEVHLVFHTRTMLDKESGDYI